MRGNNQQDVAFASSSSDHVENEMIIEDVPSTENEPAQQSSSTATTQQTPPMNNHTSEEEEKNELFECNICFDTAQDPVITLCGHLFCWKCLYTWMEHNQQTSQLACPVCKAGIARDKIIPIYGRGKSSSGTTSTTTPTTSDSNTSSSQQTSSSSIPQRPRGIRTEPQANPNFNPFAQHFPQFPFGNRGMQNGIHFGVNGFQVQFADVFNFFPFPFSQNTQQPIQPMNLDPVVQQRQFLSRILILLGVIIIITILFS